MRAAGLRGRTPKRWRTTTSPTRPPPPRPDLVGRDFTADPEQVNARWCGDITYIRTWEGWLYLATVIDFASRRVVGWAMADHLRTDLPAAGVVQRDRVAAADRAGVIFHSDRGVKANSTGRRNTLITEVCDGATGRSRCVRCRLVRGGSGRRIGRCGRRCVHRAGRSRRVRCSGSSGG